MATTQKVNERPDYTGRLSAAGWAEIVLNNSESRQAVEQIQKGEIDPLAHPILDATQAGWITLETGSGWGTLSAMLAQKERRVAMLDWSFEIAASGQGLLRASKLEGMSVCADLFSSLPFADESFDCVWSSGVLEHFGESDQLAIIRESARVARHIVISLVPNSWSIAYRLGKWRMEKTGTWQFGYERPMHSQRQQFQAAGLVNIRETTINASRSAWFLTDMSGGRWLEHIWCWLCQVWPVKMNTLARQGYMLVTIGDKP